MEVESGATAAPTAPTARPGVAAVGTITVNAICAVIPTDVDHAVNSNVLVRQQCQWTGVGVFQTVDCHVGTDVDGIKREHRNRIRATVVINNTGNGGSARLSQ